MDDFLAISIRCPRCLIWSMDDASFCHNCGKGLRPRSEEFLFNRNQELLAKTTMSLERIKENMCSLIALENEGIEQVSCKACKRLRDRRKMKKAGSFWFCHDHVECRDVFIENLIFARLRSFGLSLCEARSWLTEPNKALDNQIPLELIKEGYERNVLALLDEMEAGFAL